MGLDSRTRPQFFVFRRLLIMRQDNVDDFRSGQIDRDEIIVCFAGNKERTFTVAATSRQFAFIEAQQFACFFIMNEYFHRLRPRPGEVLHSKASKTGRSWRRRIFLADKHESECGVFFVNAIEDTLSSTLAVFRSREVSRQWKGLDGAIACDDMEDDDVGIKGHGTLWE